MNGDKKYKEIYDKFGGSYGDLILEHLRVLNELENTYCPQCEKLLIERDGFSIAVDNIKNEFCPYCGKHIAGSGMRKNRE